MTTDKLPLIDDRHCCNLIVTAETFEVAPAGSHLLLACPAASRLLDKIDCSGMP